MHLKYFKNYKVVFLTEKSDSQMENAFMGMEMWHTQQAKLIKNDQIYHSKLPTRDKIEIFVPFSFAFPENKVPSPIKLFTLPLREINKESFAALLSRDYESPSTILCQEVLIDLTKEDDIFSFLFRAFEKSSLHREEGDIKFINSKRPEDLGLPFESIGGKKDIEQIKVCFRKLTEYYCIQDSKCELNLSEKKLVQVLNDNKTTTFFSMWQIQDEKLKYFLYIELLLKIRSIIAKGLLRHRLLLNLEEIRTLLPKVVTTKYETELINQLLKVLFGARSSGVTTLATTQSYFDTNSSFRDGEVFLMKLGTEDQRNFVREFNISQDNARLLNSLDRGNFTLLREVRKEKDFVASKFRAFHMPFAYREEGDDHFWTEWKRRYPQEMISYKETIEKMRNLKEEQFNKQLIRQEEYTKKLKERQQLEEERKILLENKTKINQNIIVESQKEIDIKKDLSDIKEDIGKLRLRPREEYSPHLVIKNEEEKIAQSLFKTKKVGKDLISQLENGQLPQIKEEKKSKREKNTEMKRRNEVPEEKIQNLRSLEQEYEKYKDEPEFKLFEIVISNPQASWEDRTLLTDGLNELEMQKKCFDFALKVKDISFIKRFFRKEFIEEHYSKEYQNLFVSREISDMKQEEIITPEITTT